MEDKITKEELDASFLEVRKAYRLLYKYQRRVLDLVKYINDFFGWSYGGGRACFSFPSPPNNKGSLDNWAWDWLNMYQYEFASKYISKGNTWDIRIRLTSDTGYFQARNTDEAFTLSIERTYVDSFSLEDISKTILSISIAKEWEGKVHEEYGKSFLKACKDDESSGIYYHTNKELSENPHIFAHIPLSLFVNEAKTKEILEELEKKSNDIGIEIQKKVEKF